MKKLLFLSVLFSSFFVFTKAQVVRKGAIETATIKVPSVQCDQCKDRIEKYVSREDGVQKIVVDYKRKTAKVTYLWDRTNIENIKTAIANVGYDADDVSANGEAYDKLPTCCKKSDDGGDHNKK
ncbi:MAG: heavy-metal-associated domain-containing protein [Chitinophagales bacterium]